MYRNPENTESANPESMSNIFKSLFSNRAARKQQVLTLETLNTNQVKFGEESLKALGPKIQNNFSPQIKSPENFSTFKNLSIILLLKISENLGAVSLAYLFHAKSLRSEVSWVFLFCKHANTILIFAMRKTMYESVLIGILASLHNLLL